MVLILDISFSCNLICYNNICLTVSTCTYTNTFVSCHVIRKKAKKKSKTIFRAVFNRQFNGIQNICSMYVCNVVTFISSLLSLAIYFFAVLSSTTKNFFLLKLFNLKGHMISITRSIIISIHISIAKKIWCGFIDKLSSKINAIFCWSSLHLWANNN